MIREMFLGTQLLRKVWAEKEFFLQFLARREKKAFGKESAKRLKCSEKRKF